MMARWLIASAAALLTALGVWLTILNPDTVRVQLTPGRAIERSLAEILIATFALGAGIVTLLASTRGIQRAWRRARQRRRHARLARAAAETAHARSLVWAGAYDQARSELRVDADQVGLDPERVELAAEAHLGEGQFATARALLERAVAQLGPQPRLLDLQSQAAERSGDLTGAITTLEQLRPSLGSTPRLARRLRDLYVSAERFDDALALQSDILLGLRRGPLLAAEERALVGLRYVLACRDPEPRRAARRLAALARQAPEFTPAVVAAGDRWQTAGRTFFARRLWERGVLRQPAEPLLDRLEALYISTQRPDRTERLYRRLRSKFPNHPLILLRSIRHALATHRLDDATALLAQLPPAAASLPIASLLTAQMQHQRGDTDAGWSQVEVAAQQLAAARPYRCTECDALHPTWADRCPRCGTWGAFDVPVTAKTASPTV